MFKSKSQMRKLYAENPILAEKFRKETKVGYKDLPERAKKKKLAIKGLI